jgi:hypothetical protein
VLNDPNLITVGMLLHVPVRGGPDATGGQNHPGKPGPEHRLPHHRSAKTAQAGKTGPSQTGKAGHGDTTGPVQRSHTHKLEHRHGSGAAAHNRAADRGSSIPDATSPDDKPETAPSSTKPASTAHGAAAQTGSESFDAWPWLAGLTGVLAAGLVAAVAARRRLQLVDRPVGRRIPHPPVAAQQLEARLGRRQTPDGLRLADLALRAIGAHAWHTGAPLPTLIGCRVERSRLELIMAESGLPAPDGFTVQSDRWWLHADDLATVCDDLPAADGTRRWSQDQLAEAPHAWPGLIPIGVDAQGADLVLNLEYTRLLAIGPRFLGAGTDEIAGEQAKAASATAQPVARRPSTASVLAGMITAAAFTPWTAEANVLVIGDNDRWAPVIDQYNVTAVDNLDHLFQQWQRRAAAQRVRLDSKPGRTASRMRIDPDADEAWSPQIALIGPGQDAAEIDRLQQLLEQQPLPALAAVVADPDVGCDWRLVCNGSASTQRLPRTEDWRDTGEPATRGSNADQTEAGDSNEPDATDTGVEAVLRPLGWQLAPQQILGPVAEQLRNLLTATGSARSTPAPWWAADFPPDSQPLRAVPDTDPQSDQNSAEPAHGLAEPSIDVADPGAGIDNVAATSPVSETGPASEAMPPPWPSEAARITSGDQPNSISGVEPANSYDADRSNHQQPTRNGSSAQQSGRDGLSSDEPMSIGAQRSSEESDIVSNPAARSDLSRSDVARSDVARSDIARSDVAQPHDIGWYRTGRADPAPSHPMVRLLGPIDLLSGAGDPPSRATGQCLEYCAWLLEHPHSTARAMAAGLVVAEGTRRSNMSRLRNWLGSDDRGDPYLPDAYSGRIALSPLVSSDWHRLQLLCQPGVNHTSTEGLCRALQLVRGAPLADAAPGQWHWAEEMRTDMISVLRDIGAELTERALAESDIDLARWAAARALTAAPDDERLVAARIRTEHLAGNDADVERLSLQLAAQSRALGLDLNPETVDLLQQVMEGGLRARA